MPQEYPISTDLIVRTLEEVIIHGSQKKLVDLLRQSRISIDFGAEDNWNGGTYYYVMNIHIPAATFAAVEDRSEEIEKYITDKLRAITRQYPEHVIHTVALMPDIHLTGIVNASSAKIQQIWGANDGIRLFLTHRAEDKVEVAEIKHELASYGIRGFVAHEDIEPNEIWQSEIEYALSSMHALAAIVTPEFNNSIWCQQEIGFALGRGIPVFPLRAGEVPKGFVGKIQACPIAIADPKSAASAIVDLLLRDVKISQTMREVIVVQFENAHSWENTKLLKNKILHMTGFNSSQLSRLEKALVNNPKVADTFGVPLAITNFVKQHG